MSYSIDFEYTFTLEDGRRVNAIGAAFVLRNCDCCGQDHLERVDYDYLTDASDDTDIDQEDMSTMTEIEDIVDNKIYGEIEFLEEERGHGYAEQYA